MSFDFLPTPIFLVMVLGISVALINHAIKIFSDQKLLASGVTLLGLSGLSVAISRGIEKYFEQFGYLVTIIGITPLILGLVGFVFIAVCGWHRTKDDPIKRKMPVICLSIMVVALALIFIEVMLIK